MVEEIRNISKEKHIPISRIEKDLGFGNGTIRNWDKNKPAHDKVKKVADYLGVSIDTLTGEIEKSPTANGEALSKAELALLASVDGMTQEQIFALVNTIQSIRGSNK